MAVRHFGPFRVASIGHWVIERCPNGTQGCLDGTKGCLDAPEGCLDEGEMDGAIASDCLPMATSRAGKRGRDPFPLPGQTLLSQMCCMHVATLAQVGHGVSVSCAPCLYL